MTETEISCSRKGSKNRIQNCLTLRDMFDLYQQSVDKGGKFDITWKVYKKLALALLKEITRYMYDDAGEIKLNYGLGKLRIRKYKTKHYNLKRDYKASKELGMRVYHVNLHTKGYYVRHFWQRWKTTRVIGIKPYSFIPNRFRCREVSKKFREGSDYFE